jgi:hypothetical protein
MNHHDDYEDREPLRPRRHRDDEYDTDGPRRDRGATPSPQTSVVGIIGLVAGTAGLTISFIPCIGVVGMIGGGIGLGLALIGVLESRNSAGRVSMGVPLAGAVVSVGALLVGGFWLVLMTGAFRDNQRHQADHVPVAADDTPLVVPAEGLDRDYDANEIDADRKYRDQRLEVTGRVKRISGDATGRVTVVLGGLPASSVNCVFALTDRPNLEGLEPGDEVVVRGRCKGKVKNFVTLEDCTRVPNGRAAEAPGAPLNSVPADVLVSEYAEDPGAADRRYKDRVLEVAGRLGPVVRKGGTATVWLQDDAGNDLLKCEFAAGDAKHLTGLRAGQLATVRGRFRGEIDDTLTLTQCSVAK